MKIEREERNKVKKKNLDFSKPLDLTIFGTDQDPCFGKHHSPEAKECGMCGDAQVCAILVAQSMHQKRNQLHAKQSFMDIEEQNVIRLPILEKFCIELLKKEPDYRLTLQDVTRQMEKRFNANKAIPEQTLASLLRKVVSISTKLSMVKTTKNRYLKLKKK